MQYGNKYYGMTLNDIQGRATKVFEHICKYYADWFVGNEPKLLSLNVKAYILKASL
jgi:hypothetical protein